MTCPSELELARALSVGAEPALDAHLAACPACRASWDGARAVIELARELPAPLPSPARREEVRTALLASGGRAPRRSALWRWPALAVAGAAAAGGVAYVATARGPSASLIAHRAHGTVHAHAGARYVVGAPGPDEIVELVDGVIDVEVAPLAAGERFRVAVGGDQIEVRGTGFTAAARAGRLAEVSVAHGRVIVLADGGTPVALDAGQSWHATLAIAAEPAPPLHPEPASLPPPAPRESAAPPPAPPRSEPHRIEPASPREPRSVEPAPRESAAHPPAPPRSEPHQIEPALPRAPRPLEPAPAAPEQVPDAPRPRSADELAYDDAWAALRGGEFARAAAGFARVPQLAADSLLAEDAGYWRAVALARASRPDDARAAFRGFVDRFPGSPHAGEASAMLGWLLIDAHAFDEAARRFHAAAGDPHAAVRSSAEAGLAALASRAR